MILQVHQSLQVFFRLLAVNQDVTAVPLPFDRAERSVLCKLIPRGCINGNIHAVLPCKSDQVVAWFAQDPPGLIQLVFLVLAYQYHIVRNSISVDRHVGLPSDFQWIPA